jgi:hypothetical protein
MKISSVPVIHEEAARRAREAGLEVVMDRRMNTPVITARRREPFCNKRSRLCKSPFV